MLHKQILTTHNLSIGIHDCLISQINTGIFQGDRIGIIGTNGSGKTTLLKTLAGKEDPFAGSFQSKGSLYEVVQYEHRDSDDYQETLEQYVYRHGLQPQQVVHFIEKNFHHTLVLETKLATFSGGQQTMVHLAMAFLSSPDILLLDEPTNHLDTFSKKELVKMVHTFPGAILCVSHDIWFLNQISQQLWIIQEGALRFFKGSFQDYQEELSLNEQSRKRKLEVLKKEELKLQRAQVREGARAQRSEQAGKKHVQDRSTGRGAQGFFKEKAEKRKAQREKVLETKEESLLQLRDTLTRPTLKKVSGSILTHETKGGLFHVHDASLLIYDKKIISHISLNLQKGERVALVGRNGSGKSSLVKAILGRDHFIFDQKVFRNPSLRFEYLDQHYGLIDPEKSILENVIHFSGISEERVRQHLSHFLFSDSREILKKARQLSGGMLARLAFVMITITPIDLLILDEPTNNLDIETIAALKDLLLEYRGGLLVISHDQDFLDGINIQKIYEVGDTLKEVY